MCCITPNYQRNNYQKQCRGLEKKNRNGLKHVKRTAGNNSEILQGSRWMFFSQRSLSTRYRIENFEGLWRRPATHRQRSIVLLVEYNWGIQQVSPTTTMTKIVQMNKDITGNSKANPTRKTITAAANKHCNNNKIAQHLAYSETSRKPSAMER